MAASNRHLIISTLGVAQILAWGSTYYLPAVIATPIAKETGWPLEWVVGGLSLGLLIAGLVSPRVGAAIDRNGGRGILALGTGCISLGLLGLAASPNLVCYVISWLVVGVGMGAGLYDAAFATLGRLYGQQGRSAITMLTLFGGLASTVCWPLSAYLLGEVGWRGTCVAYALIQLVIILPLYLLVLPREAPPPRGSASDVPSETLTPNSDPSITPRDSPSWHVDPCCHHDIDHVGAPAQPAAGIWTVLSCSCCLGRPRRPLSSNGPGNRVRSGQISPPDLDEDRIRWVRISRYRRPVRRPADCSTGAHVLRRRNRT